MTDQLLTTDPNAGQLLSADPAAGEVTTQAVNTPAVSDHPILAAIGAITGVSMPAIKTVLEEIATNPNGWKVGKAIGQGVGFATGAATLDPLKAAAGMWVGGKAGWRLANAAKSAAMPLAKFSAAIEPYMPALAALAQEGDTLGRLNTPDSIGALAKTLKPEQRYKLLAHYRNQPDYVSAITKAIR